MQILNYLDRIIETSKNTEEDVGNFKWLDTPEVIFFIYNNRNNNTRDDNTDNWSLGNKQTTQLLVKFNEYKIKNVHCVSVIVL